MVGPDGRSTSGAAPPATRAGRRIPGSAAILSLEPDGTIPRSRRVAFATHTASRSGRARDTYMSRTTDATTSAKRSRPRPSCLQARRRLRLAGLLGELAATAARRPLRRRHAARGLPRAALVGEQPRVLARQPLVAEWGQYLSERWGRKLVRVDVGSGRTTTLATGFEHPLGLAVEPTGGRARGGRLGPWRGLPHHEALSRGGETTRDAALVRGRAQELALGRVRHEAGLDQHDGHVGPVEPGQVAPLDYPEIRRARRPDELALDELPRPPAPA